MCPRGTPAMEILAIFAIDENRGFGINNHLPWHNLEELQHFKRVTKHQEPGETQPNALIMGRKTWMGLSSLPGRLNIVISNYLQDSQTIPFIRVSSYEEAIQAAINAGCPRVFVIGGKQTLEYALMRAKSRPTKVIMSIVDGKHAADTYLSRDALRDYECISATRAGAASAYKVRTLVLKTTPTP